MSVAFLEASADEHGMPAALLNGYLAALWVVARTGRRLSGDEEASCRRLGGEAAAAGLALPALVDLYMTASRRLWPRLAGNSPDLEKAAEQLLEVPSGNRTTGRR